MSLSSGQFIMARLIPVCAPLSQWSSENPVPRQGEICMEVGGASTKMKIGDGSTHYLSLPYAFTGGTGGSGNLQAVCDVNFITTTMVKSYSTTTPYLDKAGYIFPVVLGLTKSSNTNYFYAYLSSNEDTLNFGELGLRSKADTASVSRLRSLETSLISPLTPYFLPDEPFVSDGDRTLVTHHTNQAIQIERLHTAKINIAALDAGNMDLFRDAQYQGGVWHNNDKQGLIVTFKSDNNSGTDVGNLKAGILTALRDWKLADESHTLAGEISAIDLQRVSGANLTKVRSSQVSVENTNNKNLLTADYHEIIGDLSGTPYTIFKAEQVGVQGAITLKGADSGDASIVNQVFGSAQNTNKQNAFPDRNGVLDTIGDTVFPTVTAGPGALTGGTVTVLLGDDNGFIVRIVTGTVLNTGVVFSVTYNNPFSKVALATFSPHDTNGSNAIVTSQPYVNNEATTGFDFFSSISLNQSTTYEFSFITRI